MTSPDSTPDRPNRQSSSVSYADAGVNLDAANRFVARIRQAVGSTYTDDVVQSDNGFAGLFRLPSRGTAGDGTGDLLVACTDGVGTKLRLAFATGIHNTVGIDLVAMNANDAIVTGARPLFFLDYIACGRLDEEVMATVVEGIAAGCREAGCALIGGETAEMPDSYPEGEYDLAGFCVGLVNEAERIDGSRIAAGDVVLGIASSGLHSNGFSLVRRAIEHGGRRYDEVDETLGRPLGEALLEPTRLYPKIVAPVFESATLRPAVHGMAHITGGGMLENVARVVPAGATIEIDRTAWTPGPVFDIVQQAGQIRDEEMWRVFNMGVGYVMIVAAGQADAIRSALAIADDQVYEIGRVVSRSDETPARFLS